MSNNYFTVLKALFKNKFRGGAKMTSRKAVLIAGALCLFYVMIMTVFISFIVVMRDMLVGQGMASTAYLMLLITAALVVLVFGIVALVSTLYLSKDTDLFSALPIKSSTVFAAKVSFVYICEAAIAVAVLFPLIITFGIVAHAWAWFYVISIAMLVVMPSIPLLVAAIIAIPVMFIASKLRNRSAVALVFYLVLFGAFFGLYIYFIYSATSFDVLEIEKTIENSRRAMNIMMNVFYPYTALALSACGVPSYGLGIGASTVANLGIFLGISIALFALLMLACKFMYTQSIKANNQTDNSRAKAGEFKTQSGFKSLMKREWLSSFRTTQVAFQCYAVTILPAIITLIFGIVFGNLHNTVDSLEELAGDVALSVNFDFTFLMSAATVAAMLAAVGNGAATTFSREGSALSSLKILPIDGKAVLKSKISAWLIVTIPAATVALVIMNAFDFGVDTFLLSLFSLLPMTVAFVVFGALWDLRTPKLKWTDPMQAIKHNGHVLAGQFICMSGGLISLIATFVMMMNDTSSNVMNAVVWTILYVIVAIFAVVDIMLYKNVDKFYNRIEI